MGGEQSGVSGRRVAGPPGSADRRDHASAAPEVSVVVPTRNRAVLLDRCLSALRRQREVRLELIVVDDGSTDGTSEAIAGGADLVLRNPRSMGPAAARNRGIQAASAPFVAFTDDDCVPQSDWLCTLLTRLRAAPVDVVGVGGRVLPATEGWVSAYMTRHRILEPPESLEYLVTANCLYRRDALLAVGGFDENVRHPGGEDPGLSFVLRERGCRFLFEADAVVRHHYREGWRDFVRTFYRYGRGCRLVLDR